MSATTLRGSRPRPRWLAALFEDPLSAVGVVGCCLILLVALIGPLLAPYDPVTQDMLARFAPPSAAHLLGTDEFGRDVLSRLLYATRASVGISLLSILLGLLIGSLLGLVAGYCGGWVDAILAESANLLLAFPTIVLGIVILVALGGGMGNVVIALAASFIPRFVRLVRAECMTTKQKVFVEAARATGAGHLHIMRHSILPNVGGTAIVSAALWTATALRAEATLSFLGLGVQLPYPSWGNMISDSMTYIFDSPFLILWPCLAITISVVVFNLMGDALRDRLDPHLTEH